MKYFFCLFLLVVSCGTVMAQTISVKSHSAELRDSTDPYVYRIILQVPRYYPLLAESERGGYYYVRDFQGRTGWISKLDVEESETTVIRADGTQETLKLRAVVVKAKNVNIRSGPSTNHEIILRADRGVAFKVVSEKKPWVEVFHESGKKGWVHGDLVWGL